MSQQSNKVRIDLKEALSKGKISIDRLEKEFDIKVIEEKKFLYDNEKSVANIPNVSFLANKTKEEVENALLGVSQNTIHELWGKADIQFSGFWGGSWHLDGNNDKYISLYYDENGYVEEFVIGNSATETANPILADIDTEGIVSDCFDCHIPNYIYDIEDLTVVGELLATLDGATYIVCERPKESWGVSRQFTLLLMRTSIILV